MKRVLALVAAVAMVAGAYVIRSRVIESDGGSKPRAGTPSNGSVLTIGCAPELVDVCAAAAGKDLKVMADPVDLGNAPAVAPKLDAWLTYGPAPGIVNAASSQSKAFDDGTAIGTARLAVVATADRVAAMARHCGTVKLSWACLVRSANLNWSAIAPGNAQFQGTVKVGVGDPTSALGAILVGPLALATSAQPDPGIDDIDTKAVAAVVSSVDQQSTEDELTALTIQGPAAYSAVVAAEGPARRAATSTRGQGLGLTVIYPEPVARTVVVLAPPSGRQVPQAVLDAFDQPGARAALTTAGWTPAKGATTTGLPAPDVLYALRQELTR